MRRNANALMRYVEICAIGSEFRLANSACQLEKFSRTVYHLRQEICTIGVVSENDNINDKCFSNEVHRHLNLFLLETTFLIERFVVKTAIKNCLITPHSMSMVGKKFDNLFT